MKRIFLAIIPVVLVALCLSVGSVEQSLRERQETESADQFETAIEIIKKYEGLHSKKHWPYVGYGHRVWPGDGIKKGSVLSQKRAEEILRKDLTKLCAEFRSYGRDSIIMAVLAYNIGPNAAKRSTVAKKLQAGDRDIKAHYLAHAKYRGKTLSQLKRRRTEEYERLFYRETEVSTKTAMLSLILY